MQTTSVQEDKKVMRKILSREETSSCTPNSSSFRIMYYGGASCSVPFRWESQPGTPKHTFSSKSDIDNVTPLTPPPSYNLSPATTPRSKMHVNKSLFSSKQVNVNLFRPKKKKKVHVSPSSSLSSVTSSSSSLSSSWSTNSSSWSSLLSSPSSANSVKMFKHFLHDDDIHDDRDLKQPSRTALCGTMCFGINCNSRRTNWKKNGISQGDYHWARMIKVKKAVLSILGRGTA